MKISATKSIDLIEQSPYRIDGKRKGLHWHEYVGKVRDDLIADLVILLVTSLHLGASTEGADKLSEEDTSIVTEHTGVPALKRQRQGSWLIGLTSFLFILLQSACTAVMAISGLRLLIGLGSLAAASFIPGFIFSIHTDKIRIPMMVIAVLGSVLNLYVVWRIRSLRARPASQWRAQPVTAKQRRSEMIQIVLSILTLFLVAAELLAHHVLHGAFL
jgi:hypothetical protein